MRYRSRGAAYHPPQPHLAERPYGVALLQLKVERSLLGKFHPLQRPYGLVVLHHLH